MTAVDGVVADCTKKIYHFSPGTCYTTNNYMAGTRAQMQAVSARPGLWSLFNPANSNNTQYRPLIQPGTQQHNTTQHNTTQHTQHKILSVTIISSLSSHSLTHSLHSARQSLCAQASVWERILSFHDRMRHSLVSMARLHCACNNTFPPPQNVDK